MKHALSAPWSGPISLLIYFLHLPFSFLYFFVSNFLFAPPTLLFSFCSLDTSVCTPHYFSNYSLFFALFFRWLPANAEPCPHPERNPPRILLILHQRSLGIGTRITFSSGTSYQSGTWSSPWACSMNLWASSRGDSGTGFLPGSQRSK